MVMQSKIKHLDLVIIKITYCVIVISVQYHYFQFYPPVLLREHHSDPDLVCENARLVVDKTIGIQNELIT